MPWLDDDPDVEVERAKYREAAAAEPRPNGRGDGHDRQFQLVRFGGVHLDASRPYLIKNLFPREGLAVVWGPPKCGKTFWVFDAVMHVALGRPYRGRRVTQGTVVYVACEGERGLAARTEAFRQRRLDDSEADPPFYLLATRLDLVADVDRLKDDITAQIGDAPCSIIVVDTLNRSIAGSENDPKDMTAYVRAADALGEAFHCLILLIHHCGIDGSRPRGFSGLSGAADVQIAVQKDVAADIVVTVELMKDGPEGDTIVSRLAVVEVGLDEDGEPITSCVVEPVEGGERAGTPKSNRLPAAAKIGLDTLRKAILEAGVPPPASNHIPPAARTVDVETWRKFHYTGTASDGQSADARKKAFQRVRQQLQAAGVIGLHADLCWVVADA